MMGGRGRCGVGLVAAAVILAPLVSVGLPYRDSLMARAGLVAALTAALAAAALATPGGWQRLRGRPRALLAACAAWAAVAVLGALVAVVRGNDPTLLAGQLLALGLLPAAAAAGLALAGWWRSLAVGVVVAVTLGSWIQLGWWLVSLLSDRLSDRLYLPNSVSVVGPALLALVLAVSLLGRPQPRQRALAWLAILSLTALIAGSAVRALWLVTPLCLGLSLILARSWSRARRPRHLALAAAVVAAVVTGHVAVGAWLAAPRTNQLSDSPGDMLVKAGGGRTVTRPDGSVDLTLPHRRDLLSAPFPVEGPGTYLLQAESSGGEQGSSVLFLGWLDAQQRPLGRFGVRLPAGDQRVVVSNVGATPEGTRAAFIRWGGQPRARGTWNLARLSLRRLGPKGLAPLLKQRTIWLRRLRSLASVLAGGDPAVDPALAFRLTETRRVLSALGDSSLLEWVAGRGLGATVHLGVKGYDNRGNLVWYGDVNYIHNLYLFLLYKLGLIGGGLALAALAVWIGWTARATRRSPPGERRAFLAAIAAAWIGYCAWAVTSPEIVDFAMTPLFGLLVAAAADAESNADVPSSQS